MKTTNLGLIAVIAVLSASSLLAQQQNAVAVSGADQNTGNTTKIYDLGELSAQPKPIHQVQPLYPAELKAARISGEAVVTFLVDVDGSVKNLRVERETDKAFGEAALQAVSAWKFSPGYKDGTPVCCQVTLPLKFAIKQ